MVSRRTYASITSMMLVVCFLFLLPQFVKDQSNPYTVNSYVAADLNLNAAQRWKQPVLDGVEALRQVDAYDVFIGSTDSGVGHAVTSWAEYTKTVLAAFESVSQLASLKENLPDVVVVEGDSLELSSDLNTLLDWNEVGVTLIFAGLPESSEIQKYPQLQELLGIRQVVKSSVQLEAVRLFSGFLLGGERIYGAENERMDLKLEAPWFYLTEGTEVYLMGEVSTQELPEQQYRNERLPALLWRRSRNAANVFVVNGDYLSGNTGIGILSAIMAENAPYSLYPVVNAQVLTVANFPGMADENNQVLLSRYGRGSIALNRDLLWPSLESMSENNGFRMSCFEMPQYDYSDGIEPDSSLIAYYLRLIREKNAETGVSLQHDASIVLSEKWNRDQAYLSLDAQEYCYNAAFLTEEELEEWSESGEAARQFRSLSVCLTEGEGLFFFLDEDTLCQTVTHDLLNYTFRADLELLSVQTALAYSNPMLNMLRVSWPEEDEAGWEIYYELSTSNLHTYWKGFNRFERVTISESDQRIRAFLCMDYEQRREGDTIMLEITGFGSGADFILRTHKEIVAGVTGGSALELESGAWLIHADEPYVELTLEYDKRYVY